jgi:Holliday junction resolvase RusA-like endonuclease
MKQKLIIEGRLKSLNDYILACRQSPFSGNHFKHEQQEKVKIAIGESDLKRIEEYPLRVTFLFYEPNRKRDLDNISSWSHKCVMDTLVNEGIIENDGWKQIIGYQDYFYIDAENTRIEVILETVQQEESET